MIGIFSDTHSYEGHKLTGAPLETVRTADAIVHAGDFTSQTALEAFRRESQTLYPVCGNADNTGVRAALPESRLIEHDGLQIALTHRRHGGATELAIFGQSQDADIVVSGHTHRPTLETTDGLLLLNPGSHAQPRGNRAGYGTVVVDAEAGTFEARLHDLDGTICTKQSLPLE